MWLRIALGAAACLMAVALAIWTFAPQLPTLVAQGFPPPVLQTSAPTRPVQGRPSGPLPAGAPLPPEAAQRFAQSGGRAMLVSQAGQVTHSAYAPGFDRNTLFNSYSLVKSLVGVLVLRAVADGLVPSLDTRLPDLIGSDAPDVSLHDVLTMRSGLSFKGEPPKDTVDKPLDDAAFSPFSPVGRLHAFGIEAVMPRLHVSPDLSGRFHYQSANTALLGLVVEHAYGAPLQDVMSDLIWRPSGADIAHWRQNTRTGRASAYCCLYARAEDWLRVGHFLLSNGTPNAPLLPAAMWSNWIMPDAAPDTLRSGIYGQHIRHDVLDRPGASLSGRFTYLLGHGGQIVYLLPDHDMVVVRFGDGMQLLHSTLYDLAP